MCVLVCVCVCVYKALKFEEYPCVCLVWLSDIQNTTPWLVWLNELSADLQTKGSSV